MDSRNAGKVGLLVIVTLLLTAPTRRAEDFGDFIGNYNFRLEIDGVDAGQFTAIDGLSIEQEVIEFQNGDDPVTRKRPGRVKYGDITLKKGYVASTILNDWIEAARNGNGDYTRKNMSIILCDNSTPASANSQPTCSQWRVCHLFPKRWQLNARDGAGGNTVTEEITFAVEEIIYEPELTGRDCTPRQDGGR